MNKGLVLFVIFFASMIGLKAQLATDSHYSRFGLGDFYYQGNPVYNSLAGAVTGLSDPKIINPSNPASYTSFLSKSFLLSTGGWHQTTRMKNDNLEQLVNHNGFSHFIMGFPVTKGIGFSTGILPFSSIGYNINTLVNNDVLETANYSGDGGISKIYFGAAYKLLEDLSIGVNASYLFGDLNRRKELIYSDATFFNSRSNSKINLRGYYYELGMIYDKSLNDNEQLSVGVSANNNSSIGAEKLELIESFRYVGVLEVAKDTFINLTQRGTINLPKKISAGISYRKDKKWLLLVNYSTQDWTNYEMFNETNDLVMCQSFAGGIEYIPDYNSLTKYYKRINYRFGVSYKETPLELNTNQIKEMSISFGFGLPFRRSGTKYDFSCTLGERGTIENNLIEEKFIRIGVNISYNDIWFLKQKYD